MRPGQMITGIREITGKNLPSGRFAIFLQPFLEFLRVLQGTFVLFPEVTRVLVPLCCLVELLDVLFFFYLREITAWVAYVQQRHAKYDHHRQAALRPG